VEAGELTPYQLFGMQPVLAVPDVEATATWYRDKLGFSIDLLVGDPPVHARVVADPTYSSPTVHIRFEPLQRGTPHTPTVYLWLHVGSGLDRLYQLYRARRSGRARARGQAVGSAPIHGRGLQRLQALLLRRNSRLTRRDQKVPIPSSSPSLRLECPREASMTSTEFEQRMESEYRNKTAPWETGQPCSEMQRRLAAGDLPKRGTALDLGCGTGVQTLLLAAHGLQVVGVDLSITAIEEARQRASAHPAGERARFVAGDVSELRGIGEPFDVLVDRGCYHLARRENLDAFLRALEKHSRPGSLLLLLAFSAAEPPEFPVPVVTENELRSELGGLFEITDLRTCRLDKPKGFAREPLFWSVMLRRR
jgi:2-polyprenyl-3-methyl-5-hydroxy-6-metoxy-1,4-benzoquinol methylase